MSWVHIVASTCLLKASAEALGWVGWWSPLISVLHNAGGYKYDLAGGKHVSLKRGMATSIFLP